MFRKYNQICSRIEKLLEIKLDSKPINGDGEKYIKTKIRPYGDSVITNFHSKKMPKEKAPCICLSITLLDSVNEANNKYYPQTL